MRRSTVDVVVPFVGSESALHDLAIRLGRLSLGNDDSVTVVDNRPTASSTERVVDGVRVVAATERQSSYFARNVGARRGHSEWIVFLDADVEPALDLVERYVESEPGPNVGLLAGGVVDGPPPDGPARSMAERYAILRGAMAQDNTMGDGRWAYAQTANCAVRRSVFEQLGGFRATLRSGGDADLCFRLRSAGWDIERRYAAQVVHRSRPSVKRLLAQRARHGSGAAWLNRAYPGSFPSPRWSGLAVATIRWWLGAGRDLARGQRNQALLAYMDSLSTWAFELGRAIPNELGSQPRGMVARGLERLLIG